MNYVNASKFAFLFFILFLKTKRAISKTKWRRILFFFSFFTNYVYDVVVANDTVFHIFQNSYHTTVVFAWRPWRIVMRSEERGKKFAPLLQCQRRRRHLFCRPRDVNRVSAYETRIMVNALRRSRYSRILLILIRHYACAEKTRYESRKRKSASIVKHNNTASVWIFFTHFIRPKIFKSTESYYN